MNYTLHRIAGIVKNHLIYYFTTAMSARFFTLYNGKKNERRNNDLHGSKDDA